MSTTYFIENSPSGRAKCKKCKEVIAKGELRIATVSEKEGQDFAFTTYNHPKCFAVPPRALRGVSPEDFVADHLEDRTADGMLDDDAKRAEVIADIAYKPPRGGGAKGGNKEPTDEVGRRLAQIRAEAAKLPEGSDSEDEDERPAKKTKKGAGNDLEVRARALRVYDKMKADDLKNVLRWNLGYGTTGNKDNLLLKIIDGHVNGRLGRCPTCFKGKLYLKDEDAGATVVCKGYYDEDIAQRIPCAYSVPNASAPRLRPWYSEEPTEEEIEAMKAITEQHEAAGAGGVGSGGGGEVPPDLRAAAEGLEGSWDDLDLREKAQAVVDACSGKLDLPQDEKKARQAVGKILTSNKGATAIELVESVVREFGIASAKEEAKEKQRTAMEGSCACPANAGIVQALKELSDYYFRDGNSNAGLTYKKAIAALSELHYEIDEGNAKGLGKGKTKVAGIGKGTADKIHEFYATGTIAKLEEKRMLHSSS